MRSQDGEHPNAQTATRRADGRKAWEAAGIECGGNQNLASLGWLSDLREVAKTAHDQPDEPRKGTVELFVTAPRA